MADIPGATSSTYTLVSGDAGKNITVKVTATNAAGSANATSASVGPVTLGPSGAFLARTSGLDTAHTNAYTALIDGLVADGVWAKLDVLRIYATQNQATALLNLVSSSYNATISGSPVFVVDRGFSGSDGTNSNYLLSNYNPATAGSPKYTQNSCHIATWTLNNTTMTNPEVGFQSSGGTSVGVIYTKYTDGHTYVRPQATGASGGDAGILLDKTGLIGANRSSSWQVDGYRNGAVIYSHGATPSTAITSLVWGELAINNAGLNYVVSGSQQAVASWGASLTATEWASYYARLNTYMNAIFSPVSIAGLIGWWDTSVFSSMTIISGEVNGIASMAPGAPGTAGLGGWNASQRAPYSATGFNGLPAMVFNNNAIMQQYQAFPFGSSKTEFTIFAVCQLSNTAADYGRLISYNANGQAQDYNNDPSFGLFRVASTAAIQVVRNTIATPAIPVAYNTPLRIICTYTSAGVLTMYINGVAVSIVNGGPTTAFGSVGSLFMGAGEHSLLNRWAGPVSDAGVANTAVSAAMATQLDNYLAVKWNLTPYNPASLFLARTSGLDATHTSAYTTLVNGLVADGVWNKLDALYIFATQDSATALLNLKSSSYNCTAVNGPTFTADRGFTGATTGNKHLTTGFNPATAGGMYTQNSAHLSLWNLTAAGSGPPAIGCQAGTSNNAYIYAPNYNGDNQQYVRINSGSTGGGMGPSNQNTAGHYLGNRGSSGAVDGYRNGSATGFSPSATASVSMPSVVMTILGVSNSGTVSAIDNQAAAASIGAALSAAEVFAFYNRLYRYFIDISGAGAEARAFLLRTSGLDMAHIFNYATLINGLVADGVWAKLDVLHVYATQDSTTAKLNLVSSSYNGLAIGSPAITFVADRGFTGGTDASTGGYIDPVFNPATVVSSKHVQNSAHVSAWPLTNFASNTEVIGANTSGGWITGILTWHTTNNAYFYANTTVNTGVAIANSVGHYIANRSNSSTVEGYKNGSLLVTNSSNTSVAPSSLNIVACGYNLDGSARTSAHQLAMMSIGGALTSTEATAFYTRLRTYMTAVGVP